MKRIFRVFSFIALALILSVISCQHDDASQQNGQLESETSEFIIQIESGLHFRDFNPTVYQKLAQTSHHVESINTAKDGTGSSPYSLNLNTIQIIERNTYTQYTTPVLDHSEQETHLINYMFLEFDDGAEYQFLIKYPQLITDQGLELDQDNAVMVSIDGEIIFNKSGIGQPRPCLDGVPEIVDTVQQYNCIETRCTGNERHTWGEVCPCVNLAHCTMPTRACGWQTVNLWGCSGGGVSGTGTTTPTGGNSSDPNNLDPNDDDPIETVPVFDLIEANTKRKLLEYSDTTIIKNKLSDLSNKIFNPNYHLEDGAMFKRLGDGSYSKRDPDVLTELGTEFIPEFQSGEVVSLHMHAQKAWDYSETPPVLDTVSPMFSKIDVHKFLKFRKFRKDTDENIPDNNDDDIVAILASKTGVYALTVGDDEKMDDALTALGDDPDYNPTLNWISFRDRFNDKVLDKCDNDDNCIIDAFIEFLKDKHKELGNQTLGIQLYQAVISNGEITRWRKL